MNENKKRPSYYIDPQKFLAEMLIYEKARNKAVDKETFQPSPYISSSLITIAENHVKSSNFIKNGTDVDALVGEAIYDSYKGLKNWDSKIKKNPFAYFSQICYYAYLRVLMKEQKEYKKKCKLIQSNNDAVNVISEMEGSGVTISDDIQETVSKLQEYMNFDLTPPKVDVNHKTRAPLYLQNRTQEEKDAVKHKKAKEITLEPLSLVDTLKNSGE